jgi:hypothetical protein
MWNGFGTSKAAAAINGGGFDLLQQPLGFFQPQQLAILLA